MDRSADGAAVRTVVIHSRALDPFAYIVAAGLGALVVALLLIGWFYPGSGADVLDWKPARSPELEAANEEDDISQMIAAQNELRRRRGAARRTEADVKASLAQDRAEFDARAAAYAADRRAAGRPLDKRDL